MILNRLAAVWPLAPMCGAGRKAVGDAISAGKEKRGETGYRKENEKRLSLSLLWFLGFFQVTELAPLVGSVT